MSTDFVSVALRNEAGEAIGQILIAPQYGRPLRGLHRTRKPQRKRSFATFSSLETPGFVPATLMRKDERVFFISSIGSATLSGGRAKMWPLPKSRRRSANFQGLNKRMSTVSKFRHSRLGRHGDAGYANELDLTAFRTHLIRRLPSYARPLFLRIGDEMEVTSTFKYKKTDLVRQRYDPAATAAAIYFNHPEHEAFVRLDEALYNRIESGQIHV